MKGKELEAEQQTYAKSPVQVFASSYISDYMKPFALQRADKAGPHGRKMCYEYMIDSGFREDSVTNEYVFDEAKKLNADYVIPKDYPGQRQKTRESVKEFYEMYQARRKETTARMYVPIQPPHAREYKDNKEFYSQFDRFALGGMVGMDPETQVKHVKEFREAAGYEVTVHGLGVGTSLPMIKALRDNPHLLDSFDVSTMETVLKFGKMPDKHWSHIPFELPHGDGSSRVRAKFASALLSMLNYMLGPDVDDDVLEQTYYEQTELADFEQAQQELTLEKMQKAEEAIDEGRVDEVTIFDDGAKPALGD